MSEMKYYGIYQGIVTSNDDPQKRGRIKVQCPTVLGGHTESAWCDPVIPVAYDNGGDFCIPQETEAVWLLFIEGDANRPVWLGGWWSNSKTPLGDDYSNVNDIRIISFGDCFILMQNDKIGLSVGGNDSIVVENEKVTISDDLIVEGSITTDDFDPSVIRELLSDVGTLKTNYTAIQSDVSGLISDYEDMDIVISQIESNVSSLSSRVGTVETNVTSLQTRISTAETNITGLTTRIGTAESNITTLQTDVGNLKTRVEILETNVANLKNILYNGRGIEVLDKLTFNGTFYFDTLFKPTNNSKIEVAFDFSAFNRFIFSVRDGDVGRFALLYGTDTVYPQFGTFVSVVSGTVNLVTNTKYVVSISQDGYYVDGVRQLTYETQNFSLSQNLFIGAGNISGTSIDSRRFIGNLYYVKLWENNKLEKFLLPVSYGGQNYLYDRINDVFYSKIDIVG